MWTCTKCGEDIEDQFDSCWKCAAGQEQAQPEANAQKIRWYEYVFAALIAYLIPWVPGLPLFISRGPYSTRNAFLLRGLISFKDLSAIGWMLVPGTITFLILLPFLRYRYARRIIAGFMCCVWFYLLVILVS